MNLSLWICFGILKSGLHNLGSIILFIHLNKIFLIILLFVLFICGSVYFVLLPGREILFQQSVYCFNLLISAHVSLH
jgi:hypothetical protein